MSEVFKSILLLALPASGKSEVRKFLSKNDAQKMQKDFHMGSLIQLDDFPYVHLMRRIDEELKTFGSDYVFFHSPDKPFREKETWSVLIHLLNEDYEDIINGNYAIPHQPVEYYLKRIDKARKKEGLKELFFNDDKPIIQKDLLNILKDKLQNDSVKLIKEKNNEIPVELEGKTIIIEFARGGAQNSQMPLSFGYESAFKALNKDILKNSVLLYIWVTPEESRKKNFERDDPNDPGSILMHSVPIEVMLNEYGCDDMEFIINKSEKPGYVKVESDNETIYLPVEKFDNRVDKTSFVRSDNWDEEKRNELYNSLKNITGKLFERYNHQIK
jgi:hypothetical protein